MQIAAPCGEQLHSLANAARLVDAALLADGQGHGQMQKRIGFAINYFVHRDQRCMNIAEYRMVLWVLRNPQSRQRLHALHRHILLMLVIHRTEKTAHILLARDEHSPDFLSL